MKYGGDSENIPNYFVTFAMPWILWTLATPIIKQTSWVHDQRSCYEMEYCQSESKQKLIHVNNNYFGELTRTQIQD